MKKRICIFVLCVFFGGETVLPPVFGVGGVYSQTKHGNTTSGVLRSSVIPNDVSTYPRSHCIHCHEQHGSVNGSSYIPFPYLLFNANNNTLCYDCHTNNGSAQIYHGSVNYDLSIHKTSASALWPGPTPVARTGVGNQGLCLNCHNPHGYKDGAFSTPIKNMAFAKEENLCLTCHDAGGPAPAAKDINTPIAKAAKHPVATYLGVHGIPETTTASFSWTTNKHVECVDCHNPHRVQSTLHTAGVNTIANTSPLYGTWGVEVNGAWPAIWTQPVSWLRYEPPTYPNGAAKEYQICFKCHSWYAFGALGAPTTTLPTGSGGNVTDQAWEFNPNNKSMHPIVLTLAAAAGTTAPKTLAAANQLTAAWTAGGTKTMFCSDCHGNDSTTQGQGPHGSAAPYILKGTSAGARTYWPTNSAGTLYNLGNNNATNAHLSGLFCMNCHPMRAAAANTWYNKVHTEHAGSQGNFTGAPVNNACIRCHILVPHGGKMSRLIGSSNTGSTMPLRYAYLGVLSNMYVRRFTKRAAASYNRPDCYITTPSACNTHGTNAGETW